MEPAFAQAMQGKISSLRFFSCEVGKDINATDHTPLIKQLAQDLHAQGGCAVTVYAYTGATAICQKGIFLNRSYYFTVAANGTWASATSP